MKRRLNSLPIQTRIVTCMKGFILPAVALILMSANLLSVHAASPVQLHEYVSGLFVDGQSDIYRPVIIFYFSKNSFWILVEKHPDPRRETY